MLFPLLLAWEKGELIAEDNCNFNVPELPSITICETEFDGQASFDLSQLTNIILDSLGNGDLITPTVFINMSTGGILKVTGLNGPAQYELVCGPFTDPVTDIAIDPDGQIFVVNATEFVYQVDSTNCELIEAGYLGPLGSANSLSFDPAGNLYAGGGSTKVYRADAGDFNNFQPWHDFGSGVAAGDFVVLGDKLYVAWYLDVTSRIHLYEVTVDESFNYIAHVDLGEIKNLTFGLASELGSLYGVSANELYEISIPDLETRTVLAHPRSSAQPYDGDAWWGGAGLHEARYEVTYHRSEEDAENNENGLEPEAYENESNPQTIYVRVFDHGNQCQELSQFQIEVFESPQIILPPILDLCTTEELGSEFDLADLDTAVVANTEALVITYHLSADSAQLNTDPITEPISTSGSPQTFYVRVESLITSCISVEGFDLVFSQKPELSIYGGNSICPEVEGVRYEAVTGLPLTDYDWEVSGGTVVEDYGSSIIVDWGETNNNAWISLAASFGAGCDPDTVLFPVVINKALQPSPPEGPVSVCESDRLGVSYSVPPVPGSMYNWTVENGTIVGSGDGRSVIVNWNANTIGKVYLEEFNPNIAACRGFSDTLSVRIYSSLETLPEVTFPLCHGGVNGEISLLFSHTVDESDITWAHGATGSKLTGLSSGTYNYTVSDANDCMYEGTVMVGDHPSLGFTELTINDISCFGAGNGQIQTTANGGFGTHSYVLSGNGIERQSRDGVFNNLKEGTYLLMVVDENNCQWGENVTINEPEPIRLDVGSTVNEAICPGSSDGELTVMALGGRPPYSYYWEVDPALNDNTITGLSKGDYSLVISDDSGCQTNVTLTVSEFIPKVYVPNAFSPNMDNVNDTFEVIAGCTPIAFSMTLFNRWGSVIYFTDDVTQGWDGQYKGEPAPLGHYTYVITFAVEVNGQLIREELRGDFSLMR